MNRWLLQLPLSLCRCHSTRHALAWLLFGALLASGIPSPVVSAGRNAPAAPGACTVANIRLLTSGGDHDWSHAAFPNNLIVYDDMDDKNTWQLYTIRPNGLGRTCLTCRTRADSPLVDRQKGHGSWHPSGKYIVLQAEMDYHAGTPRTRGFATLGRGWWNNLYVTTPDGRSWTRLTNYKSGSDFEGVLIPRFSHDGTKLFWAKLVGQPDDPDDWDDPNDPVIHPMGHWQLWVADFVDTAGGPSLRNERNITPTGGRGVFYESGGFSPDDSKVIFTADYDIANGFPYGYDLYTLDLATGTLVNLTNSPDEWDEHPHYSPNGTRISFISSQVIPSYDPRDINTLRGELMLMNPDGSDLVQVTRFNTPGAPEYTAEPSIAADSAWNADGTQISVTQILFGDSYPERRVWIVTFDGACG